MNSRFLFALFSLLIPLSLRAQNVPTAPAAAGQAPRAAIPAYVNVVSFRVETGGERKALTLISAPRLVRIDAPDERLSVIYDPATEHYLGLETSNATFWEFSWPEVKAAVQGTARYATRLRDLGPELMTENEPTSAAPGTDSADPASGSATDSAGPDDSGYVWHTTIEHKRIAGFDCLHWVGETVAGETIDAWCTPGLQAPIESAVATLREINEPMALVPVRELVPPLIFVAWPPLTKAGVTPIDLAWGGQSDASRFTVDGIRQREGKAADFRIPALYRRTTLSSMDGIGNQKPVDVHAVQQIPTATPHDAPLPPH